MIGFWNYTVVLTYLSLISSFVGIALSVSFAEGSEIVSLMLPIACLLLSGFCDLFDGRVARSKKDRTDDEKAFGIQIDSLCDLVCFTVFPATLGFCLGGNPVLAAFSGACIVLGGVIRLAYFNIVEIKRQSNPDNKENGYTGLPVTTTALIVPALFLFKDLFGDKFPTFFQLSLIVISILFISKFKIKKPGVKEVFAMVVGGVIILALLVKSWFVLIPALPFLCVVAHMLITAHHKKETEK